MSFSPAANGLMPSPFPRKGEGLRLAWTAEVYSIESS
jgi:hypothetical protein